MITFGLFLQLGGGIGSQHLHAVYFCSFPSAGPRVCLAAGQLKHCSAVNITVCADI